MVNSFVLFDSSFNVIQGTFSIGNYAYESTFVSNNEYLILVEFVTAPFSNWILSMNTTASLSLPNSIINISSSSATGNPYMLGTMLYMSNQNEIVFLWC